MQFSSCSHNGDFDSSSMDAAADLNSINPGETLTEFRNWVTAGQVQSIKTSSVCFYPLYADDV